MNATNNTSNNQQQYRMRINGFIRVPEIRVILSDGTNAGIMNTYDALKLAREQGLDLVEINPKAVPPVCRITDFGKMKYEEKKKQAEEKKKQKVQELKELTCRPNTDEADILRLVNHAKEFLAEGSRCKLCVKFRGREITHLDIGRQKLEWFVSQLKDLIAPNPQFSLEGKLMSVIVAPVAKKS